MLASSSAPLLIVLLRLSKCTQAIAPPSFKGVGHETVLSVDLHESAARQVGFVARMLYVLAPQLIGLLDAHRD